MKKYIPLFEEFNNLNEAKFAPRNTMTFDEFVNRFSYDKSQLRIILKFFAEDETVYSYMDDNIKYFINKNYIPVNTGYTGLTLYQSKKDGSAIIEEWSGGAEGYYVYYTQASKLQESILNEAASKKHAEEWFNDMDPDDREINIGEDLDDPTLPFKKQPKDVQEIIIDAFEDAE